jgi:hypothetical protein
MKRMFLVVFILIALSFTSFAAAGFRIGISADVASKVEVPFEDMTGSFDLETGFSLHAAYLTYVGDEEAIRIGGGATFWIPRAISSFGYDYYYRSSPSRSDYYDSGSMELGAFAFYLSALLYPTRFGGEFTPMDNLYGRINLGYNIPSGSFFDGGEDGLDGGLYFAIGVGYDIGESLYAELMYARYNWSWYNEAAHYSSLHLTFGFRF